MEGEKQAGVKVMGTRRETSHGRIVLFIGAPGSGKGTQSSLLASRLGIACISTGSILREEAKRNTPEGFRLRQTMSTGALVDDATVCETVVSRIGDSYGRAVDPARGLILDGFPRTVGQARRLDRMLETLGAPGPLVLHLDVPNDVLLRRLVRRRQCAKCGAIYSLASRPVGGSRCQLDGGALVERDDDSEGVVAQRIATWEAETIPVVDYYKAEHYRNHDLRTGIYRRLDGNLGAEDVAKDVCNIVLFADTALAA